MQFDINRLLKKKGWTGEEAGKALIYSIVYEYTQLTAGNTDPKPLFPIERLSEMINGFRSSAYDIGEYNRFIELQNWVKQYQAVANANFQRFQSCINEFIAVVRAAETAENEYRYIEQLPRIVTQKQYDALKAKRIEETLDPEGDGTDAIGYSLFQMIIAAAEYYALQISKDPKKANPLKAVKKLYQKQQEKNPDIIYTYNKNQGFGYYQLPDGTRSDEVESEEWKEALKSFRPDIKRLEDEGKAGLTGQPGSLSYERLAKKARALHMGKEPTEEPEEKQTIPEWHVYTDAPEGGLTKWDIVEASANGEVSFFDYYSAYDNDGTDEEIKADVKAFKEEFPELAEAILKAFDGIGYTYGEEEKPFSSFPAEEWDEVGYTWREMYNIGFPGFREWVEADTNIFDGDKRALVYGIAVLRASDLLTDDINGRRCIAIDEDGNYKEPEGSHAFNAIFGLEKYTPANPESGDDIDYIEQNRNALEESLRWLIGYDTALDLIAEEIGIPGFTVFRVDIERCLSRTDAVNSLFDMLYKHINDMDYADKEGKAAKLEALRDVFYPLKTDELLISEERKKEAAKMIAGLKAFDSVTSENQFINLLTGPEGGAEE